MIKVTLPDGRVIEVDAPDAQSAAAAAHKFSQANPAQPAAPQVPNVDVPGIEPQFSPSNTTPGAYPQQAAVQGAGSGLAHLVGGLPDLASGAANIPIMAADKVSQAVGGPELPFRFPSTSALIKEKSGALAESVGIPVADYSNAGFKEALPYNVADFGTQAAGMLPALVRAASRRAGEIVAGSAPKWFDDLVRPYMGEGSTARPIAGDLAAAGGTGTAKTAIDQTEYKDNPIAQTLAGFAGGAGGMTVASASEAAARRTARAVKRPFGGDTDKSVPVDPETMSPVAKAVSDAASAKVQGAAAYDPAESAARIQSNQTELRTLDPNAPIPSPAALAEDPGLASLERAVRRQNPGQAMASDRDFASGVRDTIDRTTPAGADPAALVQRVQQEADTRVGAAQGVATRAEAREGRIADIRQGDAAEVTPYAGRGVPASQRLDRTIVDEGYVPARTEKNRQFDTAPGRNEEIPADDVFAAIDAVRANNNALRPDQQLPGDLVRRLDALRPRMEDVPGSIDKEGAKRDLAGLVAPHQRLARKLQQGTITPDELDQLDALNKRIAGRVGGANDNTGQINVGGSGTALGGDLADTRKFISTAYEQAQRAGNFDLADSLARLRAAINQTIETAPGYTEANANYGRFADTYRPSPNEPAAKFTRAIDRDPGRGNTPPSETAGRFIQPQSPEAHAALRRMIDGAENPAAGNAAAREYLMSDLEASGVVDRATGALRPERLQAWQRKWGDLETVVPGIGAQIAEMTDRATRGERVAGVAAERTQTAQRNVQQTQRDIDKGALGQVLQADPDKAVASIMSNPTRSGRGLDELIAVTAGDPAARNGLKAAVRDYLIDKATTNASEKLRPGDRRGPVSQNKLATIFGEHEQQLAQIFSPEEMNTLRAGHRALELANIERLRTSTGSDTAEKVAGVVDQFLGTGIGKGVEAALRLKYGLLKAGGLISTVRRQFSGVTGGPDPAEVSRLVERAAYDPELMGLLLGRKLPVGSPAWNKSLNRLLGYGEGARATSRDDDKNVEK